MDLGHRNLLAREAALIERPCGLHHQQAADLDLGTKAAQHDLDAFTVRKADAEALAARGIVGRDLDAAPRKAQPAHAMRQPRDAQPGLDHAHPPPLAQHEVARGDAQALEQQLAMAAMLLGAHDRDAPQDPPAGIVAVKQKAAQPVARIVRGPRDQHEMLGRARAGDEPLVAVDHVIIAVPGRGRAHHPGVRARPRRRLGHREGRSHAALGHRAQPPLLLLGRAEALDHHHVAVIGRGRVEHHRPEDRAVHLLVADGHADPPDRAPAEAFRELQVPQAPRARPRPHPFQKRGGDVFVFVVAGRVGLERQKLGRDEIRDLAAQRVQRGGDGEVHEDPFQRPDFRDPRRGGRHRPQGSCRSCRTPRAKPAAAAARPDPRAGPAGAAGCAGSAPARPRSRRSRG